MRPPIILFVSIETAIRLHTFMISNYGGCDGIRELSLLESALAQPKAIFAKQYLHSNLFEMAAAYSYHLIKNHPFVDGNKRIGTTLAIHFLALNNIELKLTNTALVQLALDIANSQLTKTQIATYFKNHSRRKCM